MATGEATAVEHRVRGIELGDEVDLLAFVEASGHVVDRHLHRAEAVATIMHTSSISKLKPSPRKSMPSMHSRAEHLEHRVDVGRALLVQHVERLGEEHLCEVHQERLRPRRCVLAHLPVVEAERTRPEHEARAALQDWLEQRVVVVEVVLEVGVLDQADRARRLGEARADGVALAARGCPRRRRAARAGPRTLRTISRVPSVLLLSTTMISLSGSTAPWQAARRAPRRRTVASLNTGTMTESTSSSALRRSSRGHPRPGREVDRGVERCPTSRSRVSRSWPDSCSLM